MRAMNSPPDAAMRMAHASTSLHCCTKTPAAANTSPWQGEGVAPLLALEAHAVRGELP